MTHTILWSLSLFILCTNGPVKCLSFHENSHKKFVTVLRDPNLIKNTSIKKSRKTTVIPIKNHAPVVFKDSFHGEDDLDYKKYSIVGYLKNLSSYLVQVNLYERGEFLLVTSKGQIIKVWGMPILSPDGKTIACFSQGIEYPLFDNGVQVIDIQANKLVERCRFTTEEFEPIDLKWTGSNEITIKAKIYEENPNRIRTAFLSSKLVTR